MASRARATVVVIDLGLETAPIGVVVAIGLPVVSATRRSGTRVKGVETAIVMSEGTEIGTVTVITGRNGIVRDVNERGSPVKSRAVVSGSVEAVVEPTAMPVIIATIHGTRALETNRRHRLNLILIVVGATRTDIAALTEKEIAIVNVVRSIVLVIRLTTATAETTTYYNTSVVFSSVSTSISDV